MSSFHVAAAAESDRSAYSWADSRPAPRWFANSSVTCSRSAVDTRRSWRAVISSKARRHGPHALRHSGVPGVACRPSVHSSRRLITGRSYRRCVYERLRAGSAAAFRGTPVRFSYLFGSHARGGAGPRSDVDVAVHLAGAPPDLDLLLDLVRRIGFHTGVETDLVVLDEAPLRLVERVLRDGRLSYSADEAARIEYEATMRRVCADFAIHSDRLDHLLLDATARGHR